MYDYKLLILIFLLLRCFIMYFRNSINLIMELERKYVQVKKYFGIKMGVKTPLSASQFHYSVSICDNFSLKPYFVSSISENELSRILKKFVFRIRCISSNECAQISQILQSSLWIRSCFENVFLKK